MADSTSISANDAAKLARCTPRHLARLRADGWIKQNREGRYTLLGVVYGRYDYYESKLKELAQSTTKNEAVSARAREINLRIAQKEGELIAVDDALAAIDAIYGVMRSELNGLAARVTREREMRFRIEEAIDGALNRAAKRIKEQMEALRKGGDAFDAVAEDDS